MNGYLQRPHGLEKPMTILTYLSCPYSDPSESIRMARYSEAIRAAADLQLQGRFIICPVIVNHPIEAYLKTRDLKYPSRYWADLEKMFSSVCDELVILPLPGWKNSRGVQREMDLFRKAGKPMHVMTGSGGLDRLHAG